MVVNHMIHGIMTENKGWRAGMEVVRNERTRDDDTQSEFREEGRPQFLEMTGLEKRKGKRLGCW